MNDLEAKAREILRGDRRRSYDEQVAAVLAGMRWAATESLRVARDSREARHHTTDAIRARFLSETANVKPEGATRQGVETPDDAEGRSPLVPPLGDRPAGRVAPPAPSPDDEPSFIAELPSEQDNAVACVREMRKKHGNPFESDRAALVELLERALEIARR